MKTSTKLALAVLTILVLGYVYTAFITPVSADSDPPSYSKHLDSIDYDSEDWRSKDSTYWKKVLTKKQYEVCRQGGTEYPFTGYYNKFYEDGVYRCSSCGNELFSSDTKFDSRTGWPSFWDQISPEAIELKTDTSHGMVRTEIVCGRCGAHLGHVFEDGPKPTGKRYCVNSVCLLHTEPVSAKK